MLAIALAAVVPLAFHYDAAERTNVVYQVACMAEQLPCSRALYDRLWKTDLGWNAGDQADLDAWKAVFARMESAAPKPAPAPLLANYPDYYPNAVLRQRLLAIAIESPSTGAFRTRAQAMVSQDDARRLGDALDHFTKRLRPWWTASGRALVEKHIRGVHGALTKDDEALAQRVSAFVNADLSAGDAYVHIVPSPAAGGASAMATVVRTHFFVEILSTDQPADTAWKAMHELTHAFYHSAPRDRHLALMQQFVDSTDASAPAFYLFLNEAIATAVQLIVMERHGIPDTDPYRQAYIPRLAAAAVPLVKAALAGGRTLTDGFVEPYLQAGRSALKDEASSLKFTLSATALIANASQTSALQAFANGMGTWGVVTSTDEWREFGELNAVFLLDYDGAKGFSNEVRGLDGLMRNRGFAYTAPYKTKSRIVVLAARDTDTMLDLVKRFAALTIAPPEGVLITIP